MFPSILFLAASALGINYGWEPLPEGGMKYIVQFEPETLVEAQKAKIPLESDIPSEAGEIRSISIRLGSGEVPRISPPAKADLQLSPPDQQPLKPEGPVLTDLTARPPASALPPPSLLNPQGQLQGDQTRAFKEPSEALKTAQEPKSAPIPTVAETAAKSWMPLVLVSLFLCASLGGNFYLLWLFAELRKRYRELLTQ